MNQSHAMRTLPEQDRPPEKLAHLVFKSRDKKAMMDWYATVLLARTVFDNHFIGFLSFDDEHHRVAVIEIPSLSGPAPAVTERRTPRAGIRTPVAVAIVARRPSSSSPE